MFKSFRTGPIVMMAMRTMKPVCGVCWFYYSAMSTAARFAWFGLGKVRRLRHEIMGRHDWESWFRFLIAKHAYIPICLHKGPFYFPQITDTMQPKPFHHFQFVHISTRCPNLVDHTIANQCRGRIIKYGFEVCPIMYPSVNKFR